MNFTEKQLHAGQAIYTAQTLNLYNVVVLGISNHWLWKCPTERLVQHYNRNVSANHLDIGVGTGYYLDKCIYPTISPRIGLMDLNADSLAYASKRISRYKPQQYQYSVLSQIPIKHKFDSIGINYLLHCLPGTMEEKSLAFDCIKPLMAPGAVIFGSTLLHEGVTRNGLAKKLMAFYNKKGVFSNQNDSAEGLRSALNTRFQHVSIEVVGCVAIFSARLPCLITNV